MNTRTEKSDPGTAINAVLNHLHNLVRKELALFKSEMSDRVNHAVVAVALIGLALVMVVTGLHVLAAAATAALVATGLSPAIAAIIIAAACIIIAAGLALKARSMLKNASVIPHASIKSVQRDAEILKETYND